MTLLALLAASIATTSPADGGASAGAGAAGSDSFASSRISATGTATVRIQRGFAMTAEAFGKGVEGARARKAFFTERNGERRQANLIEFE